MERRKEEYSSLYGDHKLFLGEDWFEVVRVNCHITSILFFKIDILLSSEIIQFGTKITRMESNNKVELREILKLLYLPLGQPLGSRKILKIFIIHNNIDKMGWTL